VTTILRSIPTGRGGLRLAARVVGVDLGSHLRDRASIATTVNLRIGQVVAFETETVLAVVGELHPDKSVSKAARKALFKHRSSGSAGAGG